MDNNNQSSNKKVNVKKDFSRAKTFKNVSPLTERIGVCLIALITTLGATLIIYTGAQAALHSPEEMPEMLTLDDIDLSLVDDEEEDSEISDEDPIEDEKNDQDEEEEEEATAFTGVINSDGVNVRVEPEASELVDIVVQLYIGDEIEVIDSEYNSDWMQVRYDGDIAYVAKGLIDPVE